MSAHKPKPITTKELIDAISLTMFEKQAKKLVYTFEIDRHLLKSGIAQHPVIYVARILFYTFLTTMFVSVPLGVLICTASAPLIIKIIALITAIIAPSITFTLGLTYPMMLASTRKDMVENELPFFMAYLTTMVRGGVSVERVIERVANLRIFKYIRAEARRIMLRVKFFGDDPISAIEHVAQNHPSPKFRDILLGYTTTLRTGGDVLHYLEIRTQELFASRTEEIKRLTERMQSILELYIIVGVVMSMVTFVFFGVTASLSTSGSNASNIQIVSTITKTNMSFLPALYSFIVLPIIGIATLAMAHSVQPKNPIPKNEPYVTLLTAIPLAPIMFVLILNVTGGTDVFYGVLNFTTIRSLTLSIGAALLTLSIPPWITYSRQMKGTKGIIKATADFLRDLSEVRKTGLSPEKCIITLSHRDYRNLTPIIKRAGAALATGIPLERALRTALRNIKEWFVIAIFRFLTDSIVVGGGSPEIFDALARFTQSLAEAEENLRKRLRSYVMLPYFGAILLSALPITTVWSLTMTAHHITPEKIAPIITTIAGSALLNNTLLGLIAGKVSEMNIAAGFKHVTIMTLLTVATILLTLTLLHL